MKKLLYTLLVSGVVLPLEAAFIQDTPEIMNVVDVKELKDDSAVIIQGHIIQQLEEDKYLFKDETDEVVVDIDKKAWNNVDVRSSDIIQLKGKVDKDFADDVEIDVEKVSLVK